MEWRLVLAVGGVMAAAFIGLLAMEIRRNSKEHAYKSCLASLSVQIWTQSRTKELAGGTRDWRIVSAEEFDRVMDGVQGTDCGGFDDPKLDLYGNRINIALRQENDDRRPPFLIWSSGADEISGTTDDIVIPHGETVPK